MHYRQLDSGLLKRRHWLLATLSGSASLILPGCRSSGYSIRAPYDSNVKTIYVPGFQSVTFRRDINLTLTELVIKEIERRTPYKVLGAVEEGKNADATLSGTINYSEKNIVVENPNNLPRQLTSTIIVAATYTDNRTAARTNTNPAIVADTFNFYPEIGESTEAAFYRTCEKMAIQIVNMMEEPWDERGPITTPPGGTP